MSGTTAASVRDVPLRASVLTLELAAAASIGIAHLVPWPAVGGTAVALVAAAVTAVHVRQRNVRSALGFASLLLAAAACLMTAGVGGSTLAFITLWLMVTAQLSADTLRELTVAALLGLALLLLPGGLVPSLALAVPWLVGWVAAVSTLVLAVRCAGREQTTHARARVTGPQPAAASPLGPIAAAVGVSLLTAAVVGLVMPQPQGDAAQRMQALAKLTGQTPPDVHSRTATSYLGGSMDMRSRGDLPSTPVAQVPADSSLYWRSGVLSVYDGDTWQAQRRQPVAAGVSTSAGWSFLSPTLDDTDARGTAAQLPDHQDTVHLLAPTTGFLLLPGHPDSVRTDGDKQVVVATGSLVFAVDSAGPALDYTVRWSGQPGASDVAGPAPGSTEAVQMPAGADWLQLPRSVTERTRALARRVSAGATSRGQQVAMVQQYLSSTYAYRLDSPVPPAGHDAVDDFLFDARTGFCEQFAAAEVVMLRSLGVPTRMATGYAGGTVQNGQRVLTGKDAHAWVEVWQPGLGWLSSDPTPSASTPAPAARTASARLHQLMASTRARWLAAGGLLLLGACVVGVVLLVGRRRRRRRALVSSADRAGLDPRAQAVCVALDDLRAALAEAGRPSPSTETVAELGRRVPQVGPRAFTTAERTLYGRRTPSAELVDEAVADLRTGARGIRSQLESGALRTVTPGRG